MKDFLTLEQLEHMRCISVYFFNKFIPAPECDFCSVLPSAICS